MKGIYLVIAITVLLQVSCNESRRVNDGGVDEPRNEAAAEENKDKFARMKQRDAGFVFDIVASSYGEIKLAELANQKSRSAEVKEMAQELLKDHTASLSELKTLAQAGAIEIPAEETGAVHRKLEDMAGESPENFDEKWMKEMLELHERDIGRYERRLSDTDDLALKVYINKTLPVLKKHYDELEASYKQATE